MPTYLFFILEQNGGAATIERLENQAKAILIQIDTNADMIEQPEAPVINHDEANVPNNPSNIDLFS